jgi:RNA polymerase sigma factor (sigma-70 family)
MITEKEAQDLIKKYLEVKSGENKNAIRIHENECMEKFKYLVTMKTSRYKQFSNYEDLNQEGMLALVKAMQTYDISTNASFFWWAHKYIDTRISRSANQHSTIRYPLKIAKNQIPHKESKMPNVVEKKNIPDLQLEKYESHYTLEKALAKLPVDKKELLEMYYGFNDSPVSISKICRSKGITRNVCLKQIKDSVEDLRKSFK